MTLLRLALNAAERGDAHGAAELLHAVLAMPDEPAKQRAADDARAISRPRLAQMLGCTPEHVSHLVNRGEIPADAVLGSGRGMRIMVDAAIEALRRSAKTKGEQRDEVEQEGHDYVVRRERLRVVRGSR